MNALERLEKAKDAYIGEIELMCSAAKSIYAPDAPCLETLAAGMEHMLAGLRTSRLQAERRSEKQTPGIVAQMEEYLRSKAS